MENYLNIYGKVRKKVVKNKRNENLFVFYVFI